MVSAVAVVVVEPGTQTVELNQATWWPPKAIELATDPEALATWQMAPIVLLASAVLAAAAVTQVLQS